MKKGIKLFFLCTILITSIGCASTKGYFIDRAHDAADIFTVVVGFGGGVQMRIGPIVPGFIVSYSIAGIGCGDIFCIHKSDFDDAGGILLIPLVDEAMEGNRSHLVVDRNKFYRVYTIKCKTIVVKDIEESHPENTFNPSLFTQIEATVGLGPTLKLGFNPGELLDFVLGWTNFDIYQDDLEKNNATN